jgi:DNA ligase-4
MTGIDGRMKRLLGLSWTYKIREGMHPSVLFENPLCVEVMGAGFQKVPGSKVRAGSSFPSDTDV